MLECLRGLKVMSENVIEIVEKLNYELFEKGEEEITFVFQGNGFWEGVEVAGHPIWSDQTDTRVCFDGNNREPLETHLRREFNDLADRLSKLKFKRLPKRPVEEMTAT